MLPKERPASKDNKRTLPLRRTTSMQSIASRQSNKILARKRRGPLLGSFVENLLNKRLESVQTIDGYRAELRASGRFAAPTLKCSDVSMSVLSAGDESSFPFVGQINIGQFGYRIAKKGTLQVSLFDPLDKLVNLFVIIYDLSDMPENSQTFLRQRTILAPTILDNNKLNYGESNQVENVIDDDDKISSTKRSLTSTRCMIQFNIVSSKRGKIYLNKDLRLFISKKVDLETAAKHGQKESYAFKSFIEMPENPRYFDRSN